MRTGKKVKVSCAKHEASRRDTRRESQGWNHSSGNIFLHDRQSLRYRKPSRDLRTAPQPPRKRYNSRKMDCSGLGLWNCGEVQDRVC
jgi:hypothetical protein